MRKLPRLVWTTAVTATLLFTGEPLHTQEPVTHALLIGVTNYPALASRFQLAGPSNDVDLVRTTLLGEPFRLDARHLTVLTEEPSSAGATSGATPAQTRPTRANIERELARLANDARKGDQVFILFAGHGSQQPDDNGDEDDGWDEIFLPADAGKWTGQKGAGVVNALSDDRIAEMLTAIRNSGAFVSVVFDACQSTSMTRGTDVEIQRFVPPDALGIPSGAAQPKAGARGGSGEAGLLGLGGEAGDIAALYAAQTIEPTPEKVLPSDADAKTGRVHGLFTYTLVSVLGQAKGRLTYRDLVERVIQQYKAMGRIGPTPGFEGGGLDREVLGQKNFAGLTRIVLGEPARSGAGVHVRAGEVHGLTKGTILRVFSPNPPHGTPLGHVIITSVDATSAIAEPHEYGGIPTPDSKLLTAGSRCEVAFYDYGDEVFTVAYHPEPGASPPADVVKRIDDAITALETETNGRAAGADSAGEANWLVRVNAAGDIVVAPVSGWRSDPNTRTEEEAPFFIARSDSTTIVQDLARVLSSVARARNLLRLAVAPESQGGDLAIELELLRFSDRSVSTGTPVLAESGDRTLRIGETVGFRVKNTGATGVDVTLLFIDADFGITALFPQSGREADARVPAGGERRTVRFPVSEPTGSEQIVAIAVAAAEIRQDFRALEQPPLHRVAERGGTGETSRTISDSPLGRLLKGVVQGQGATRGIGSGDPGSYVMRVLTWRTLAADVTR